MELVLDGDLRNGAASAERHLRPPRAIWSPESYAKGREVIEVPCQQMGGVADLFVPPDASDDVRPWYAHVARTSALDVSVGDAACRLAPGLSKNPFRRPPAMIEMSRIDRERLRPVEVALPREGNPWHLSYLSALGSLGEAPSPQITSSLSLRDDLKFDELIKVQRLSVLDPGPEDLAARLSNRDVLAPVHMSLYRLTARPFRTSSNALDGWTGDLAGYARQHGSSVVVVYEPGSLADLCLTWNLLAMHGWGARLPLAVPFEGATDADVIRTANAIKQIQSTTGARISGWRVALVSESLSTDQLQCLASHLSAHGQPAEVVGPGDLLHASSPPARSSALSLVFDNGVAFAPSRTDDDRRELPSLALMKNPRPDFELLITVDGDPMPPTVGLRRTDDFADSRFSGNGCTVRADSDELVRVVWPSGWSRLRAVCSDRGITASVSASGQTALALLRSVGNIWDVRWLAHRPLLALLYKKASSSGMSWWKQRSTEQARAVAAANAEPEHAMDELMAAIQAVSVSHGGESAATISFGELEQAIGTTAGAKSWLRWAESRRLLVRGTELRCPNCGHIEWRPIALLTSPLICTGCLAANDNPYNETSLQFSYRLSESLRRAIENDSIYHLLVARVLLTVLDHGPIPVTGVHPGVDLRRGTDEQTEADVLVLLGNGDLLPVEVKKGSGWFTDHDIELLDKTAAWLDSPATILATADSDDQLQPKFLALAHGTSRPLRRLLSADDWLNPELVVTMDGSMPGPAGSTADTAERRVTAHELDEQFAGGLIRSKPDQPAQDPVSAKIGRTVNPA